MSINSATDALFKPKSTTMNHKIKLLAATALALSFCMPVSAAGDRLVILHTNDTHSQIDPDSRNLGGMARRKVLIDSVRAANDNVMLVDAGDAVQGTLYFSLFGGEVERKLMNSLGYDIQILGNHEFDNGMDALANLYKGVNAEVLSSNYRLDDSSLKGLFKPYTIRRVGDKKVGFIAVNLIPDGMIAADKCRGVKYLDGLKAANAYAWMLKNMEGCDMVVALTHVGYENVPGYSDVDLAKGSEDIDVIIGGHSHTTINPDGASKPWRVANLRGDSVLIAHTGKGGAFLGEIDLDLDSRTSRSKLLRVDSRLDGRVDPSFENEIAPYRAKVDSVMAISIGYASADFPRSTPALDNLISDAVRTLGDRYAGRKTDLAIMNHGGLRADLRKGKITKGDIMQIMPFDNYVAVLEIKGSELMKAFDVMARRGGVDGVSSNVRLRYKGDSCVEALVDGKPVDPERVYTLSTINYLADGGDYMTPLKEGRRIAGSPQVLYDDIIGLFTSGKFKGKKLRPDMTVRIAEEK